MCFVAINKDLKPQKIIKIKLKTLQYKMILTQKIFINTLAIIIIILKVLKMKSYLKILI